MALAKYAEEIRERMDERMAMKEQEQYPAAVYTGSYAGKPTPEPRFN